MTVHPRPILAATVALLAVALSTAARADIVTNWNQTAIKTVLENPPVGLTPLRNLAIVHLAVHDAVNAAKPKYEPYLFKARAPDAALPEAAALSAAFNALVKLYPTQRATLEADYKRDLARLPDSEATQAGLSLGQQAAERLVESRAGDGIDAKVDYVASSDPLAWRPTPPGNLPPLQPQFAKVKPFFVTDALQFDPGPPLALTSKQFADEFDEVKRIGARDSKERTADQTAVAIFWTAPSYVIFSSIARQLSDAQKFDLHDNARLFALLFASTTDGYISGWAVKYKYPQARPITLIREADKLSVPGLAADPNWEPLLITPNHPNYISGHSIFAGTAEKILQAAFGGDAIPTVSVTYPASGITRRYDAISQIAEENDNGRVWGGIHTRQTVGRGGADQGRKIGEYAVTNFLLKIGRT
jgi:hypothetical protein